MAVGETDPGRRRVHTLGDLAVRLAACTDVTQVGPAAEAALAADPIDFPFVRVHAGSVPPDLAGPARTIDDRDGKALVLPLAGERGVLVAGLNPDLELAGAYRDFLDLVAATVGAAIGSADRAAVTLQRSSHGPAALPDGIAARYEPARGPLEVGGDWYDVAELPDGSIGLMVGDCVGRGLAAAVVMGQLRGACRALSTRHSSPADLLFALDEFAGRLDGAAGATVLCARLDRKTGEVRYSCAGHPPGIVVDAGGGRTLLDRATSVPLAVADPGPRPEASLRLAPGSTLLLYTAGLVERAGEPSHAGIAAAAHPGIAAAVDAVVADRRLPAEALADRVLAGRPGSDDVVVLVYRHAEPSATRFARSFPADPAELARARAALTAWLRENVVDQDVVERAVLAAGEAWTNAIEHGYGLDRTCTVHTTGRLSDGELEVTVADLGGWQPPGDPGNRGRGIPLMDGVCDRVSIEAASGGTTVRLILATEPPAVG